MGGEGLVIVENKWWNGLEQEFDSTFPEAARGYYWDVQEIRELSGLVVEVTDVVFMPGLDASPDKPFPFVYFITVRNESAQTVTIKGRKWIVLQSDGDQLVVEGDGVVGQTPCLEPGDVFSYNSYHTIGVDSVATGTLFAETETGQLVFARIPDFQMKVPQWA